jgi:PAS domain S-box-containing protein
VEQDSPVLEDLQLSSEQKLGVFRRATALMASSRSFDETMSHTIAAFLPELGDFGFFDLDVGGSVRRTSRAHEDPRVEAILKPTQWIRQERTDMNLCALSTGRPALHPDIGDTWYQAIAANPGHLQVLRELAFTSMISVPMRYQDQLLGALTLFFGRSGRRFGPDALAFASELAAMAAPVVANARLLEQQRVTTEALRASEERMRVGMDAGKLGVWDWDVKANRVTWSDRIYDLHGITREQWGGRVEDFAALVHPDDAQRVQQALEAALRGGGAYELEFRALLPGGTVRWLATRAEVYRDEQGEPVRMVGATYDVTERRALLAEAAQARTQAEAASRAKDEFLAMLGHELRNPLAPIVTALQLMERRDGEHSLRERAVIQRQVTHMIRLVDDLLDIARISRGKFALVKERVDVIDVVENAVEESRAALKEQQLSVSLRVSERPVIVEGDRVRLAQIVGNLLANAAKFSPSGQTIAVRAVARPSEVAIEIEDQGAGIDPDLLPRIFDQFVQGPQELARRRGGLGLGLAIVSNLVSLHGGKVSARSEGLGRGSTFTVVLPRAAVAQAVAGSERGPAAGKAPRAARVLVVDDNLDSAQMLAEFLIESGLQVRLAGDAPEALKTAREFAPDVAILDIGLPTMDGYQLAEELRRREHAALKLIAMTGYGRDSDRARARSAGFDDHFVKPVDPNAVVERIAALTAGAR